MVTGFCIGITQNSQSLESNSSNVTVALTITWNGGSYNATGNASGVLNIDGTDHAFTAKFNTAQISSGSEVIFSKTLDIAHSAEGKKTLSCSANFSTGTAAGTVTAEATKTLTQIPRESTIGATDASIGATSVISISRKNKDYTHSVSYSFGTLSGYLADGSGTLSSKEVKLSDTGISFPIPESFYAQIPDATFGNCTLTVKTYASNQQIGNAKTCVFRVTASEELCCPEVSGTVVDVNEKTLALTGDENRFIRGMSIAKCTITASAKNGATLRKKTIENNAVSEDVLTITGLQKSEVDFDAVDSRGYRSKFRKYLEMVEYIPLTCNAEAVRTDPTSGNGTLQISGNYFDGFFGMEENFLQISYQVDDGEEVPVLPQIQENRYTAQAELRNMDYQTSHTVTLTVQDQLMTLTKSLTVGKGIPVFDWGEGDFAFNVPVSIAGGINGVYMGCHHLEGINGLVIQTELGKFDGTGKGRQTFFITGNANSLPVYGLVGVWLKDGSTFVSGTGIASATSDLATGQVGIAFEATPWDSFTVISNKAFAFV